VPLPAPGGPAGLDGWASADVLGGDRRPGSPGRPAAPGLATPLLSLSGGGNRPLAGSKAIVVYDSANGHVGAVVAPFADTLSAEQYAISSDLRSYDVVPATTVTPEQL
jgi:hypothetical protein